MTDRATLEALLARVLEGTGPDRELDAEIHACLTGRATHPSAPGFTLEAVGAGELLCLASRRPAPPFTASLDAVLRDLLPEGWGWARTPQEDKVLVAVFIDIPLPDGSWKSEWIGEIHADDKRALIAACLKARMEAQGE